MGVRAGQGYGVPKPKRAICPDCGKKGVTQPKLCVGTFVAWVRNCQYCGGSWTELAWKLAKKIAAQRNPKEALKPTVADWIKKATGQPPGWCDAGGQFLGWGATQKVGDMTECEVCGKRVKLREMLSTGSDMGPAYPRHKRGSATPSNPLPEPKVDGHVQN